ncbi:MAG TPA: VWA domain-containing protein, partial [Paracoccus sp.]|nr:VWA domain-containing protein [Paracoccus sp. (in: a-proteobacteria)]
MGFLRSILLALLVLAGGAFPAAAENRNVTVVYDVSGSMWGQIDGVAKVTIAREVLGDMLATWPEGRDFGLIAYGHRREGDCGDIEQVVSLGPLDAQSVRAQINALMPRGRTPLTDAVRLAAESMRYQDLPATVILVTDGLETCNADPCALAAELARAGVNFTAHVVGFDIAEGDRAQVACIAEATGGLFVPADNAQELSAALQQVTMAEPEPEPEPDGASLTLRAIDAQSGLPIAGVTWSLLNANTETEESHTSRGESLALTVEPGDYRVTASHDGRSGGATISALLGEGLEVVIELAEDLPEASVQAGAEIAAGSVFEVVWSGPDARQDYITIVPAGAPEADYGDYWRTNRGSPAQLTAPDALGPHEVRYVHQETRRVLAVQPVTLTPVSAALDAPESAIAGAVVEIGFEGPDNPQDYITVVEAGAPEGSYNDYWRTNRG